EHCRRAIDLSRTRDHCVGFDCATATYYTIDWRRQLRALTRERYTVRVVEKLTRVLGTLQRLAAGLNSTAQSASTLPSVSGCSVDGSNRSTESAICASTGCAASR